MTRAGLEALIWQAGVRSSRWVDDILKAADEYALDVARRTPASQTEELLLTAEQARHRADLEQAIYKPSHFRGAA